MKVSISYLNTFIFRCGLSLVIDRPDRPVAVIFHNSFYCILCRIICRFYYTLCYRCQVLYPPLIHHQNATCGVSCGSISLRRMPNTTPGAAALLSCIWHLAGGQETIETNWESNGYKIRRWIWAAPDLPSEYRLLRWLLLSIFLERQRLIGQSTHSRFTEA